jgi:hypothetical protein
MIYTEQDYINEINRLKMLVQEALSGWQKSVIEFNRNIDYVADGARLDIARREKKIAELESEILLLKTMAPVAN